MKKINVRSAAALVAGVAVAGAGTAYAASAVSTPSASGPAGLYTPVTPTRALDTRLTAAVPANGREVVSLTSLGVPSSATAVQLNVTVTQPKANGDLAVVPDGTTAVTTSNLNWGTGQTIASSVVAEPGADGKIDLVNQSTGTAELVVDVEGYYAAPNQLTTTTRDLGSDATAPFGGSFVSNAVALPDTLTLPAGTYVISASLKAAPTSAYATANPDVQVTPGLFLYTQAPNANWMGDLLNLGSGSLETGGNDNVDMYYSGQTTVTLTATTTITGYVFGYGNNRGAGTWNAEDATVTATQISNVAQTQAQ